MKYRKMYAGYTQWYYHFILGQLSSIYFRIWGTRVSWDSSPGTLEGTLHSIIQNICSKKDKTSPDIRHTLQCHCVRLKFHKHSNLPVLCVMQTSLWYRECPWSGLETGSSWPPSHPAVPDAFSMSFLPALAECAGCATTGVILLVTLLHPCHPC